jgi:hypothetical protein
LISGAEFGVSEDLLQTISAGEVPGKMISALGEIIIENIDQDPTRARLIYFGISEKDRNAPVSSRSMGAHGAGIIGPHPKLMQCKSIRAIEPEAVATVSLGIFIAHCAIRFLLGLARIAHIRHSSSRSSMPTSACAD